MSPEFLLYLLFIAGAGGAAGAALRTGRSPIWVVVAILVALAYHIALRPYDFGPRWLYWGAA